MPEEQIETQSAEPEEASEETTETSGEEEISVVGGGLLNLLTPEGIIMMPMAMVLDGIGIILILFALDDFFITDIIGTIIIGGWLFFRTGTVPSMPERIEQKTKETAGKVEKGAASTAAKAADAEKTIQKVGGKIGKSSRWLKPLLCGLGEFVPYLGVIPFWTYLVYSELTK
ncbi:MAG: hypothetical protein Q8N65_00055 [bacterium]|nr:hypothetical protein [bacterium]